MRNKRDPMKHCLALCLLVFCPAVKAADEDDAAVRPYLTIETGGHRARIRQVLFSRDSKHLLSVSQDKTIRIWDVTNREPPRVLRPPVVAGRQGELFAAALSPDGKTLAVGGWGYLRKGKRTSPIFLISLLSGEITRVLPGDPEAATVLTLAFAPQGNLLASAGMNLGRPTGILLWDVASGKLVSRLDGHTRTTTDVVFAPDGKRLASVGLDKVGRIWSVESGKTVAELKLPDAEVRYAVAWSPDGKYVAAGATNKGPFGEYFALWRPDGTLKKKIRHDGSRSMGTQSLHFTVGSSQIVESCRDGYYAQTTLYDVAEGKMIRHLVNENHHHQEVPSGPTAASPNSRWIAMADDRHHAIYLKRRGEKGMRKLGAGGRQITGVGWVNDKKAGGRAIVWRTRPAGPGFQVPRRRFRRTSSSAASGWRI